MFEQPVQKITKALVAPRVPPPPPMRTRISIQRYVTTVAQFSLSADVFTLSSFFVVFISVPEMWGKFRLIRKWVKANIRHARDPSKRLHLHRQHALPLMVVLRH